MKKQPVIMTEIRPRLVRYKPGNFLPNPIDGTKILGRSSSCANFPLHADKPIIMKARRAELKKKAGKDSVQVNKF